MFKVVVGFMMMVPCVAATKDQEAQVLFISIAAIVSVGLLMHKYLNKAKDRFNELLKAPANPSFKLAVVEFNVPGAKNGGTDKGPNGHRIDSIPIANGVIKAGGSCDVIKYHFDKHADFARKVQKYDALIVRINPGQLSQGTSPGTQQRFDDLMNSLLRQGKLVWSSPEVQTKMGAKDALVAISDMKCGLPDTMAYYSKKELEIGFKKTCAFQPRVIKQNRGSAGEGIWLCWLEGKKYCKRFGDKMLKDDDMLKLMEMNDNHIEYHTVKEFLTFCVDGPDAPGAGTWKSTFPGKYLDGGKAAGGQLVDQRLLPRISEGEVRCLLVGDVVQMIIHKKPEGGLSAVGGNSAYTYYKPGCPEYKQLEDSLKADIPKLLSAMDLAGQPLPLLWTADFIPKDAEDGTPGVTEYVVGEFNCSCVGVSKFQAVCGGKKTLADVPDKDYFEACQLTDLMGVKAIQMLQNTRRHDVLMPSPANPTFNLAVVEFNVPGAKNGGTDKGPNGHRIDSIPIANGIIKAGGGCDVIKYSYDKHDEFSRKVQKYDALVVRINPGQLSQGTSPGTQQRFDDLMNSLLRKGKLVWSSPEVQTKMGAKDALVAISDMKCGLPDTMAYYTKKELEIGFKKTCAFQPRVIKQNRGSAGEGIWLCWLEGKNYCKRFGDAMLKDDDMLKLMEMNDNHIEYHTVKEFLTFCVDGPDAPGAGKWTSTFPGKYLDGGKAAGGQLVDQRLLPRISEGEVRCLLVGNVVQMIIHKKPEGGLSAVGGNSAYTYYKPGCPEYKQLEDSLKADIPKLLNAMDLAGQPLPLLWTADFIPKDAEDGTPGVTEYVVGEFNCSCVGVSKFQAVCGGKKTLADVPDADYFEACQLTDLMGTKAIEMLQMAN